MISFRMKLERQELKAKDADSRLKDSQKRYEEIQAKLSNLQRSAVESLQNRKLLVVFIEFTIQFQQSLPTVRTVQST